MKTRKALKKSAATEFCDHECKFAQFPDKDGVDGMRSCRTFVAIFCTKRKTLVHKNLPCRDKIEGGRP